MPSCAQIYWFDIENADYNTFSQNLVSKLYKDYRPRGQRQPVPGVNVIELVGPSSPPKSGFYPQQYRSLRKGSLQGKLWQLTCDIANACYWFTVSLNNDAWHEWDYDDSDDAEEIPFEET